MKHFSVIHAFEFRRNQDAIQFGSQREVETFETGLIIIYLKS